MKFLFGGSIWRSEVSHFKYKMVEINWMSSQLELDSIYFKSLLKRAFKERGRINLLGRKFATFEQLIGFYFTTQE